VVATGLGGAQQFGYGPPRKHVIGMKVVRADGSLIKVGGRVVKNVAGYDLCKLFTGSYGTLGLIVEVNFKLRPLPFATRTVMSCGPREGLLSGAQRVINSPLFPVAVELLSPPLASEAEWSDEKDSCLLIRFAGNGVIKQVAQAIELLQCEDGPKPLEEDDSAMWESLAALPSRFQEDLVWRVGLLPADVPAFLAKLDQEYGANGQAPMWQASIADGRIRVVDRFARNGTKSGETGQDMIARLESFRNLAKNLGGTLIIEYAPAEIGARTNTSGTLDGAYGIMKRIKDQLDPNGIFPPLSTY
jgi:FAD/FMN-containing dehydrogenase